MQASVAFLAYLVAGGSAALRERTFGCSVGWLGFNHLKFAFVFGDSYTATGFNFTKEPAPSRGNPFGNPPYPGETSSNGENWIDLLTTKYNASNFLTFNLAVGGATVDSNLVKPLVPTLSLKQQVEDEFMAGFSPALSTDSETDGTATSSSSSAASTPTTRNHHVQNPLPKLKPKPGALTPTTSQNTDKPSKNDPLSLIFPLPKQPAAPGWTGLNSLFAIWIGINDVNGSFQKGRNKTSELNKKILTSYAALVDELYEAGARNFLIVNVPSIDRSPGTVALGKDKARLQKDDVAEFNALVAEMAAELKKVRKDANVWLLDANSLFERALDDPKGFEQTRGLRNMTQFCDKYAGGTPKPDTFIPRCGIPANQYFWLNGLHPTTSIHEVVADQAAQILTAGPNVCAPKPNVVGGLMNTLSSLTSFVGEFWQCGLLGQNCKVNDSEDGQ